MAAILIRSVERLISHSVTGPRSIRINCFRSRRPTSFQGAVRKLGDSLNGIAKKDFDLSEMIPQDLTQGAAKDLEISTNATPKLLPAHALENVAVFVDELRPCISVRAATTAS